ERTGRLGPGEQWYLAHLPGPTPVVRVEHPRRPGPAGAEPDVVLAAGDQAGAAGCEGALLRQGGGSAPLRQQGPRRAAVVGDDQVEPPAHGVAEGETVLLVPEGDGVEERPGLGVLELELPGLAAVRRLVDPGVFAGAGAQQVRHVLAERLDVAEVELVR